MAKKERVNDNQGQCRIMPENAGKRDAGKKVSKQGLLLKRDAGK